jgi:tetratricopeptide (TPR) repeat protein
MQQTARPFLSRFRAATQFVIVVLSLAGLRLFAADSPAVSAPDVSAKEQAAQLNNLGVALMDQQLQEKAVAKFDAAFQADPTMVTAEINKGIALLYLGRLPESEKALEQAATLAPTNPRVWYNLGLVRRSQAMNEEGIKDFSRVLETAPNDPDTHYFLGMFYLQSQDYDKAIKEFETVLRLNKLHPSAEFGLARALQREGNADGARAHLATFTHLTRDKIAGAMTNTYGEQGPLSLAQDVHLAEPKVGPMIPVTMVQMPIGTPGAPARPDIWHGAAGGGVCLMDAFGSGREDLVSMSASGSGSGSGAEANAIRLYRNKGAGSFEQVDAEKMGLTMTGSGVSCAVGDFDNDGLPDLAVASTDGVALFRNSGGGKFVDVTKSVGITNKNKPSGLTFVDFDHDGDLDLLITGDPLSGAGASAPNVLWRNNGNSTFTEWTAPTGLGGTGSTFAAILSDLNNDRAVDLLVTGSAGAPIFYANQREGPFLATPLYDDATLSPAIGVTVLDFDKDGWMDVALTHAGAPGVSLWRNVEGKHFERVPLPITDAIGGYGITPIDIDNDGWIDLAVSIETKHGQELRLAWTRSSWRTPLR